VTNYRSQFNNEIRQVGGMDGLIQRLAEKNKEAGV
jgi:ABC-type transporter MlaC component